MGTVESHLVPAEGLSPGQGGKNGGWFFSSFSGHFVPSPSLLAASLTPTLFSFCPVLQTLLTDSAMSFEVDWWKGEWEVGGSFN